MVLVVYTSILPLWIAVSRISPDITIYSKLLVALPKSFTGEGYSQTLLLSPFPSKAAELEQLDLAIVGHTLRILRSTSSLCSGVKAQSKTCWSHVDHMLVLYHKGTSQILPSSR